MPRSRSSSSGTTSRQGDNGHFEWTLGQTLNSKYSITGFLGDGTFGRVLKAKDPLGTEIAIKVIRAVPRYVEAAKIEAEIIERLNKADPEHKSKIVQLIEHFPLDENYCLVFEKLGKSLFDVIKDNQYKGKLI
jgi:serine/threonine protein kinase